MNARHRDKRTTVSLETAALLPGIERGGGRSIADLTTAALKGGADGIMLHITEDQGVIGDEDLHATAEACRLADGGFHLRMTPATDRITTALRHRPQTVYLSAEARLRTEVSLGLSLKFNLNHIQRGISTLADAGIGTVISLEPNLDAIEAALRAGLDAIELDCVSLCQAIEGTDLHRLEVELGRMISLSRYASRHGVEVQLGGGLTMHSLQILARLTVVRQMNLGRATVADALVGGMANVVGSAKVIQQTAGLEKDSCEARRQRLANRANDRGLRDLDIILSSFFDSDGAPLDDPALLVAERILELPDPVLYDLICDDRAPANGLNVSITNQLREFYRRNMPFPNRAVIEHMARPEDLE